ncbi:MAG: phage tail protein, partial [Oscillibacter sp.]
SNIQRTVGHEDFVEGGLNDYIHVLTKPDTTSGSLTFEKGVVADAATEDIIRALAPGIRISVPVTITLYHRAEKDWKAVRSWGFEDGMVTQWELGNLDGMGNEVSIEKMTISHAGLQELKV